DHPLKKALHRPHTSRKIIHWSIKLSELEIHYKPRPTIKAQVLADFVVKCTIPDDHTKMSPLVLFLGNYLWMDLCVRVAADQVLFCQRLMDSSYIVCFTVIVQVFKQRG
ncbi:hypothetical protein CFOL_v3_16241, partial [Cephalotus follicularis]